MITCKNTTSVSTGIMCKGKEIYEMIMFRHFLKHIDMYIIQNQNVIILSPFNITRVLK